MAVTLPTVNEVSIHIAFHNHPISLLFHKTVYDVNLSFEVRSVVSFVAFMNFGPRNSFVKLGPGVSTVFLPYDLLMAVDSAINNGYFIVFYKTESFTAFAIKTDSKMTDKYVKIILTYL